MGRPQQSADLLLQGFSPSQIASKLDNISIQSVKQYLFVAVGWGLIIQSDILFSISRPVRSLIEQIIAQLETENPDNIKQEVYNQKVDIHFEDLEIYLELRRAFLGDLYVFLTDIERTLHDLIKKVLQQKYDEEENWWRKGIPENVRKECASRRETDKDKPVPPYCYTTLIQLKDIIDRNWILFKEYLPPKESSNKRDLMEYLVRINNIRNKVMHPIRQTRPTDDEFEFVRDMHQRLDVKLWKGPS